MREALADALRHLLDHAASGAGPDDLAVAARNLSIDVWLDTTGSGRPDLFPAALRTLEAMCRDAARQLDRRSDQLHRASMATDAEIVSGQQRAVLAAADAIASLMLRQSDGSRSARSIAA